MVVDPFFVQSFQRKHFEPAEHHKGKKQWYSPVDDPVLDVFYDECFVVMV